MQLIVRFSCEGHRQIDIAQITGVTQGAISKILKRVRQTGSPNQRPLGHRQSISTPREDRYLLRMMRANRILPIPRFSGQNVIASTIGDIVSSLTSQVSSCITSLVRRRQGERHIDVCVQETDGNVSPSVIIWSGFHYGGKCELVVLDGSKNQQVYRRVLQLSFLPWQEPPSKPTLPWSKIMLRPTEPEPQGKSWVGHPKVRIWTP